MEEREKIAHALRRLGLGAGKYELARYQPLGLEGALKRLIDFDQVDEGFNLSPWSFAVQPDGKLYTDPYQVGAWWGLRFLMTQRPLQERLTLFWHDHFAVSGEKVFEGATMRTYTDILRQYGCGKFRDLLKAVSKHAALIAYLDANTSTKAHPNENFAREMFELFTLGVGNYTEQDVREAARAFTGWSLHFSGIGDDTPYEKQAERAARQGMSLFNFCWVPAHHDQCDKTVLGKRGPLTGDDVLDLLADHPQTARFVCTKLWEFFAHPNPEKAVIDALVGAWRASDGEVRQVLWTMVRRPEFWDKPRSQPKSPLDWTVAIFRAFDLQPILTTLAGTPKDPYAPVRQELRAAGGGVFFLMTQQGLTLLFPPNVGGWDWGDAWITANNTVTRVNHAQILFIGDDPNRPLTQFLAGKLKQEGVSSAGQLVDAIASVFDVPLGPDDRHLIVEACEKAGGVKALDSKETAGAMFAQVAKLMFAVPAFQLC